MDSTTTLSPDEAEGAAPLDETLLVEEADAPQVLLIRVGADRLAIQLEDVRAVTRGAKVVRLPGAPAWVRGLAPARGTLAPVADLPALGGCASEPAAWRVLVERDGRAAYLAVDGVDGVQPIDASDATDVDPVVPASVAPASTLPRCGAVRLQTQGGAGTGDATTADVLDVAAVFRELFEED